DDKPETKQTHSDEIPKKEVTTAPRSQTPKTVAKQAVLPSTGEGKTDNTIALTGLVALLAGGFGLSQKRRTKKED
ncbi:LPXTG cell wall anchor domain-containing protein, partial [Streptococcus sciuri]